MDVSDQDPGLGEGQASGLPTQNWGQLNQTDRGIYMRFYVGDHGRLPGHRGLLRAVLLQVGTLRL